MAGFRYREVLHGGYYFLDEPRDERAIDLAFDVEVADWTTFVSNRTARLSGPIKIERFADETRGEGKLVLDPEKQAVNYEVSFASSDGRNYRLRGYKQFDFLNLVDSFTLVRASLYDDRAREVGRAVVRFDARGNWSSLAKSFRLVW